MKFDVNAFTKCLAEKILYVAVFLSVFFGLIFSAAMSMAQELQKPSGQIRLPLFLSFTIHLGSFVLMSTLAAFLVTYLKINPFLMCFIAGIMGIGSLFVSKWIFNVFNESDSIPEFLSKLTLIIRTFWTTFNNLKNKNDDTTNN